MAEFDEVKTPDMDEPFDGPGRPPAVRALFLALFGGLAVVAVPYALTPAVAALSDDPELIEDVSAYRAWWPGDPVPFSGMFRTSREKPAALAVAVSETGEPDIGDLGELPTVEPATPTPPGPDAKDPGTPGPGAPNEPTPAPGEPTPTPPTPAPHPYSRIHIPDSIWESLTASIEDPNHALGPAWDALAKVFLKEPGAMMRIAHFGDSAIAADGMPSSTRRHLQRIFGDGGHGYSLVAASNNWYRRKDVDWDSRGFSTEVFISDDARDRRYGFGGTAAIGTVGARASWKTVPLKEGEELDKVSGSRASRFVVYYQANPRGGEVAVWVDGAEHSRIDTTGDPVADKLVEVAVADGPHTFELRVTKGRVKLYGVAIERESGVVVDGLGIIGARDSRWLNQDADHVAWAFEARDPDLAVFMYGGNQLEDKVSMAAYEDKLTETVRLWKRGLAGRSCLLMSPIDHGERHRGRVRTVPRQVEIMAVQREVALAEGCAWFSLYDAMGGDGAIGKWFEQGLAEGDLAHPTAKGAILLGRIFYMALMKSFHEHIARVVAGAGDKP